MKIDMNVSMTEPEIREAIKEWFEKRRPDKKIAGGITLEFFQYGPHNEKFRAKAEIADAVVPAPRAPEKELASGENARFKVTE